MDKLRNLMEAAILERWQDTLLGDPALDAPSPETGRGDPRQQHRSPALRVAALPSIRSVRVSRETLTRNHLVAALPERVEREAYRPLQATVARRYVDADLRVIGVTSPSDGSGKTLTAANLAISLAVDARRSVMLIDLDLEAPGVQSLFEVDLRAGVEDCLFNGVAVRDALFCPAIDGLKVLPARGCSRRAARVVKSRRLATMLDAIKRGAPNEILVLDLPSTAIASDAEAFEELTDGIVLVVENDVTEERDYRRALESFSVRKMIGTVLNRVPPH